MDEILAIAEMNASTKVKAPVELSVEDLMVESAMNSVGVSSDKSEEAKQELNEYIAVMLEKEKEDAFEAVRYAIYKVVPQVMTYREAVLEETADQFNAVNDLNNDMLDMQGKFGAAGDTTELADGKVNGMENAYAYFQKAGMNADKVKQMMDDGILPSGIGNAMLENLNEITSATFEYPNVIYDYTPEQFKYGQSAGLFNGLVGIEATASPGGDSTNPTGGYNVIDTKEAYPYAGTGDDTAAWRGVYDNEEVYAPFTSKLNDNNTIIQSSLNGYSKQVEAEFKFEIEEYGQYLSLSSQMYDTGAKGNQVHVRDQRV
jgi:hypothetical protein